MQRNAKGRVFSQMMLLSPRCHHLPGNGGVKGALREVRDGIPGRRFVFRTDVKEYYAHIDHERLYAQLLRLV